VVCVILLLLTSAALYVVLVAGLTLLLQRLKFPAQYAAVVSSLLFGLVSGLVVAWLWPLDSAILFDWPGALLGEKVYSLSIEVLGDSHSPQAHYTIPWLLRVPQVMVIVSILVWGTLGIVAQWIRNRRAFQQTSVRTQDPAGSAKSM
jgi:hypothetical protein